MNRQKGKARNGLVLVCVIACLVVSAALVALAVQSSLRGRNEARLQLQLRQTELLCEAGVLRATKQFAKSENYAGEQWRPELDVENFYDAIVEIAVTDVEQGPSLSNSSAKNVTVVAKLDSYLDQDGPMQRTHNFIVPIQTLSTSPEKK
jgi:Na+-transporting NADH:ubiquinone oxidoreductase subunit NqrC